MSEIKRTYGPGSVVADKFEIIKVLGEGSLGDDIYLCKQLDLAREVTLRILPASVSTDQEMLQRFIQETRLTAALQHPNILPAYETGDYEGRYYFVTGYVKGVTLQDFLKQRGKLEEKEVLNMVIPIADALKYAWDTQKIIHRNIKPETILIADGDKPILEDFGMAKSFSSNSAELTMMNVTIGNPDYMSPEQVRGERDLDYRCDMYCLGLVLYEMLAGQHPFATCKTQFELMEAHIKEMPKRVNEINMVVKEGCTSIIEKLMQKEKDDRYPDWDTLIKDMKSVLAGNRASCQKKADKDEIEKYKQQAKDKQQQSSPKAAPQFVEVTKTDTKTTTILTVIIIVQFLLIIGLLIAFILK